MPSAEEDDSELKSVRRRFWISSALALPLLIIAMGPHLFNLHVEAAPAHVLRWVELLLSAPLVLWAGIDYYRRGWVGVVNRSPNMYTLIGLGVLLSFFYSIVATFAPIAFSRAHA